MSTMETTIEGKLVRLLGTRTAPGCLIDLWETPGEAPGSIFRTWLVVSVRTGQEQAAEPFHQWADVEGYAVVAEPASDPLERFREALRQARVRHEERHSDAQFVQVLP